MFDRSCLGNQFLCLTLLRFLCLLREGKREKERGRQTDSDRDRMRRDRQTTRQTERNEERAGRGCGDSERGERGRKGDSQEDMARVNSSGITHFTETTKGSKNNAFG